MREPIDVYIGTGPGMEPACDTLVCSIMENTAQPERIQIHLMEAWKEPEWRWWHGQPDPRDPDMVGKGYWVTPFSMFRYALPYVKPEGYAIYLDCDMIVLGDICRLYDFRQEGKWCIAANQDGDCVMVVDCAATKNDSHFPPFDHLKAGTVDKHAMRRIMAKHYLPSIPAGWNCHAKDFNGSNAQLVHYTDMNSQPWHPMPHVNYVPLENEKALDLWKDWSSRAEEWQIS